MSNLKTYYHFKLDFKKVDQHTGGKWLIYGTKHWKDNQLQSLEHNVWITLKTLYCFRNCTIFHMHIDAYLTVEEWCHSMSVYEVNCLIKQSTKAASD